MRGLAVHRSGATHRPVRGAAGVRESAEVLCVERFVALQHPDGILHLEPLPLPTCGKEEEGETSRVKSLRVTM